METDTLSPETTAAATQAAPETTAPAASAPSQTAGTLLDGHIQDPTSQQAPPNPLNQPAKALWVNDDGTLAETWRDNFKDPDLKSNPTLSTFRSMEDLARSYVESRKMIGKKLERESMPALDAPPEKWTEWRKLTGAPENPTGYGELRPDSVPKEAWDAELEGSMRTVAHKYGVPPAALKELAEKYTERQMGVQQLLLANESQKLERGRAELREAFGAEYDRKMSYAIQGATAAGFDHTDPEQRAFFTSPKALQNFARIYEMNLMGDKSSGNRDGVNGFGGSIDDRIGEVRKSPAYLGKEGPQRQMEAQKFYHQLLSSKDKAGQSIRITNAA